MLSTAARTTSVATRTALLPARLTMRTARAFLAAPRTVLRAARGHRGPQDIDHAGADGAADADRLLAAQRTSPARSPLNRELHRTGEGRIPVPNYDELGATDAATAVRTLTSASEVDAVLRHERANRNRKTVISAVNARLRQLEASA